MPVRLENSIQISGTSTPSRSRQTSCTEILQEPALAARHLTGRAPRKCEILPIIHKVAVRVVQRSYRRAVVRSGYQPSYGPAGSTRAGGVRPVTHGTGPARPVAGEHRARSRDPVDLQSHRTVLRRRTSASRGGLAGGVPLAVAAEDSALPLPASAAGCGA